jgi:hypothetical protein
MAVPPVRLDPFQNIVGVHWRRGTIITMVFRVDYDLPEGTNASLFQVELIAPATGVTVGIIEGSDDEVSDPAGGLPPGGGNFREVGVTEIEQHYVVYGGYTVFSVPFDQGRTDVTFFLNLEKIVEDLSTEEEPLTEIRLRLGVGFQEIVAPPMQPSLVCRGYNSLVFDMQLSTDLSIPFPGNYLRFVPDGQEIESLSANESVTLAAASGIQEIGELVINLADLTAAFVLS